MGELVIDEKWRKKNSLWLILAFIPVFNFLGFLYIGYKANRKEWTNRGRLFGTLNLLAWIAQTYIGSTTATIWSVIIDNYHIVPTLDQSIAVCSVVLYVAVLIMEIAANSDFLKLYWIIWNKKNPAHELLQDGAWKIKQSIPVIILPAILLVCIIFISGSNSWDKIAYCAFISTLSSLPFFYMAERANDKKWNKIGTAHAINAFVMLVVGLVVVLNFNSLSQEVKGVSLGLWCNVLAAMCWKITSFIAITAICLSALRREDYLEQLAPKYTYERQKWNCLQSTKWRLLNSWWLALCITPYSAPVSLICSGIGARKKKTTIAGILSLVLITAFSTVSYMYVNGIQIPISNEGVVARYCNTLRNMLYIAIVFAAVLKRPAYLYARAELCGGYVSEVERELDFQKAFQEREIHAQQIIQAGSEKMGGVKPSVAVTQQIEAKAEAEETTHLPAVHSENGGGADTGSGIIDINQCTEQELMQLPGITIVDAKRAVEKRETQGRFKSVDEFVSYLHVKPHFAVKIFEMATASYVSIEETKKPARRKLDL